MADRVEIVLDAEALVPDDFLFGDDGHVTHIAGHEIRVLQLKHLQAVGRKLKIKGIRGMKKDEITREISNFARNMKAYGQYDAAALAYHKDKTRKEIHCSFRLLNIVFSDKFAADLAALGLSSSRVLLDSGKAANDRHFWERIQTDFQFNDESYGELLFVDDPVFEQQQDSIFPSKIIAHDWKKLRTIWKAVVSDYKVALGRFTLSGTHDSEFWNFCQGKLEPYYLRKFLDLKPDLLGYVAADLPEGVFLDSTTNVAVCDIEDFELTENSESTPPSVPVTTTTPNTVVVGVPAVVVGDVSDVTEAATVPVTVHVLPTSARRKTKKDGEIQGIGEAIRALGSDQKEGVNKRNEIMEKGNELRIAMQEKEHERRTGLDSLRSTYMQSQAELKKIDQTIKLEQHKRKEIKAMMTEWEFLSTNINRLRSELRTDGIDEETKSDLMEDIKHLQNKKRKLTIELDINQ